MSFFNASRATRHVNVMALTSVILCLAPSVFTALVSFKRSLSTFFSGAYNNLLNLARFLHLRLLSKKKKNEFCIHFSMESIIIEETLKLVSQSIYPSLDMCSNE